MKIIIHPILEPNREIDVTTRLVAAVAQELSQTYGGSEAVNWLEAEQHVQALFPPQADSQPPTKSSQMNQHADAQRRTQSNSNLTQRNSP